MPRSTAADALSEWPDAGPPLHLWVAGLVLVSGVLAGAGYWYYHAEAASLRKSRHEEIAVIGELKARQVQQWRMERLGAVHHLGGDPVIAAEVRELLSSRDSPDARAHLMGRLRVEQDGAMHDNALLLTPDGDVLVAARDDAEPLHEATRRAVNEALAGSEPVLSDLYLRSDGRIAISAVAAVRDTGGRPLAVAILRSDPESYLYPLIESWPAQSASAETFIVQRDGDSIVWLNNARHRSNTALRFRQPLTSTGLPAVQAALGRQGVFEGSDYRGVAVLADLQRIDGSPWFMVAKIDLAEVLAEARYRGWAIALVIGLVILLIAAASAYGYQSRQWWMLRARADREGHARSARQASDLREAERIAGVGSYRLTVATGALHWSDGFNLLLRRDPDLPAPARDGLAPFYTPASWNVVRAAAARIIETGTPDTLEVEMVRPDGTTFWAQARAEAVRGPDGCVTVIQGTVHDIDVRKRAEIDRREREERYLAQRNALIALIDSDALSSGDLAAAFRQITQVAAGTLGVARVSVWRYNGDRTAIRCDDLFELATGLHSSGAEVTASVCPAYFSALAASPVLVADDAAGDPQTSELADSYLKPLGITSMLDVPIRLAGSVRGVLSHEHIGPLRHWTADESAFAVAVANTVSLVLEGIERRRAEAGVRLQSAALTAASSPMVITNCGGVIEWVNPAFTALSGYEEREALGRNPRDLVRSGVHDRAFYANLWDTVLAGHVWRGEITNRRKDGTQYLEGMSITPVKDSTGKITHFVAIKRDLTEQKQLEAQLLQSQKMEVVGRLAGGVAHDFNNLLMVINGTAELMADAIAEDHPAYADLCEIRIAGTRASSLTRQLLAFSRKQVVTPAVISLTVVIEELRSMLQRLIGEDITLVFDTARGESWVRADRGQIEQVLMNLVINSRDALPHGGTITITLRNVELDSASSTGPHVLLDVSDTGVGMDAATLSRLFEPFFTTKEPGRGTGLGLATVYGIVTQSGGSISVRSTPGEGTTFSVYLPRVAREAEGQHDRAQAPAPATETVLLVDDEPRVCDMTRRMLETSGYHVLTAQSGAEALVTLEQHEQTVHLMLTDVVMPGGMDGPALAARAAAIRPAMKVVYMSGYTDDGALRRSALDGVARFVGKPFTRDDLVRAIRETLDAPDMSLPRPVAG